MIPDSVVLVLFALAILLAPIYYGRTTTMKEENE